VISPRTGLWYPLGVRDTIEWARTVWFGLLVATHLVS
jgi:hypothetical protein